MTSQQNILFILDVFYFYPVYAAACHATGRKMMATMKIVDLFAIVFFFFSSFFSLSLDLFSVFSLNRVFSDFLEVYFFDSLFFIKCLPKFFLLIFWDVNQTFENFSLPLSAIL